MFPMMILSAPPKRHMQAVQKIFQKFYEQEIFIAKYEGWYCTPVRLFGQNGL